MHLGLALSICSQQRAGSAAPAGIAAYARLRTTDAAGYYPRDGARLEFFAGKYWLLGGWNPADNPEWGTDITTNAVWSSTDLVTWTLELAHDPAPPTSGPGARWRRRHTFMSFVFAGYLWVMGSDTLDGSPWPSDVWRSADGVTWERVAASSPWGPVYLAIPAVYGGYMHVIGGNLQSTGSASAQHWRSQDGVTWEQLPDLPFARAAVYGAVVHRGKLFIMGGNDGIAQDSATQCGDTWMWDGTTWTQQSPSAGWGVLEWVATASYDDRLWVLTGKQGAGNAGTLWYSTDLGVTWTQLLPVPYATGHADAIVVTAQHGIVLATGLSQGQSVYRITATAPDPSTTMQTVPWSSWLDGYSFAIGSALVYGKASAGLSAGRNYGAQNTPSVGTINERPTIVLTPGQSEYLRYTAGAQTADLVKPAGWTTQYVGKIGTPTTNAANPFGNASLGASSDAWWGINVRSTLTVEAYQFQGTNKLAQTAFTPDTLLVIQARYDGTNESIRINKGPWVNVASGTPTTMLGAFHVGANYNASVFVGLELAEYATADVALSDEVLDACVDDMAAKWGVAA